MKGVATEKLQGGKLARVKVDFDSHKIEKVQITGDFFLHPEEKVKEIEDIFILKTIFFDEKSFEEQIHKIAEKEKILLIGITPDAITRLVKQAIKNGTDEQMRIDALKTADKK